MAFDLTTLSAKDLDALISNAKQRKVALKKRKPVAAVREKLARAAATEGYTLDELFQAAAASATSAPSKRGAKRGAKRATTKRAAKAAKPAAAKKAGKRGRPAGAASAGANAGAKVAPKYRNPANPEEVWSGRGMAPRWMAAYLAQGKAKNDFLI